MVPHSLSSQPLPLSRRALLLSALVGPVLAACGGGTDEPEGEATPGKPVDDSARSAVAQGLVGVAIGHVAPSRSQLAVAGRRRLGAAGPVLREDVFNIGSNTKAMTSAVVAGLVEQGRVAWTTTLAQAWPALAPAMRAEYAAVTLEQLLNHRGGLPPFNGSAGDEERFLAALAQDTQAPPGTLEGRRRYFTAWLLRQTPPEGVVPGRDFLYSNAGYAVAAAMLESVTGRRFEMLFDELLVRPAGLAGAWRMPSEVPADQPAGHEGPKDALQVYVPDALALDTEPWLRVLAPAGFWACPASGYAAWLRWHLQALQGHTTPLPRGYVQRLRALGDTEYAMGWGCALIEGRRVLAHTGHEPGFMAEAVVDQAGERAVFGLTNTGHMAADGSWVLSLLDRELAEVYRRPTGQRV